MLRKPESMLKNNPETFKAEEMFDLEFMKKLEIGHLSALKKALWLPLITIDTLTALPAHPNLQLLLQVLASRMKEFATEAMFDDCIKFVEQAKDAHSGYAGGQVAENYLQISAVVNFYLGNYEEALKYLDILSYVFTVNHHAETDFKCGHFSMLAGMACMQLNQPEKAAMYYNRYIDSRSGMRHQPEEFLPVVRFLFETNSLQIYGYGLVSELKYMQEDSWAFTEIGRAARDILSRVEAAYEAIRAKKLDNYKAEYLINKPDADEIEAEEFALYKEATSAVDSAPKPEAPMQTVKDLFKHIDMTPYRLRSTNIHDVLLELAGLKNKVNASFEMLKSDHGNHFEMRYQYGKNREAFYSAMNGIDERMVKQMSLQDLHSIIQLCGDDYNALRLASTYPDEVAAKIKNVEDFVSFAQYKMYSMRSFGEILLQETTAKQHTRLLAMIEPKINELLNVKNSGVDHWTVNSLRVAAAEAVKELEQKHQHRLFVKAAHPSSKAQMVNSAFGQRRPHGNADVWERTDLVRLK